MVICYIDESTRLCYAVTLRLDKILKHVITVEDALYYLAGKFLLFRTRTTNTWTRTRNLLDLDSSLVQ